MIRRTAVVVCLLLAMSVACGLRAKKDDLDPKAYGALVQKAGVWRPTAIRSMNLRTGPTGRESFAPLETVRCTYVDEKLSGKTPKFSCKLSDGDNVKVKFGRDNGEVYAEVAATRLLWALGFGADHMYPVRVECRGCPATNDPGASLVAPGVTRFEFAAIERKMAGLELTGPKGNGWSWEDLDRVDAAAGPEAVAHRDALKLLAVLLQHTDSKREQQRFVCLTDPPDGVARKCERPFMFISDLGRTFGKSNPFNKDDPGSVNLHEWSTTPVWSSPTGCIGNIPASLTGTLDRPKISEAGRKFLADLLVQLSDAQLHDLFDGARFPSRTGTDRSADVAAWVAAFKHKVAQVSQRSCTTSEGFE